VTSPAAAPTRPETRSGLRYATAFLGAHIAFLPLFALLLPRRVEALDPGNAIRLLSMLVLAGGITASVAHIAAGRWSDRWLVRRGNRRGLIAIGLVALTLSQIALAFATSDKALFAGMIAFQIALNLMFAPLGALLADHVPDSRKGRIAGWLNATLPLASLATGLAALLFSRDGPGGFLFVAGLSVAAILPLILRWPFGRIVEPARIDDHAPARRSSRVRTDYLLMWGARLLVQLGAAFMINYFYLYLASRMPAADVSHRLGSLAIVATCVSFASAIGAGHWSDRSGLRRAPMIIAAVTCALGLVMLAMEPAWPMTIVAFVLFHTGLTAFLSVDSAMVSELLGDSDRRGELLGFMNLTNTFPSIIIPLLALSSLRVSEIPDWPRAFALAAILALVAAGLLSRIRSIR